MERKQLDLTKLTEDQSQTDQICDRLEGSQDDQGVDLWGEEYAASGGKSPPTPNPS